MQKTSYMLGGWKLPYSNACKRIRLLPFIRNLCYTKFLGMELHAQYFLFFQKYLPKSLHNPLPTMYNSFGINTVMFTICRRSRHQDRKRRG